MRAIDFWWRPAGPAAFGLSPLGWIAGFVAAHRLAREGERASLPVICVGNPVVGGAGKTPTVLAIGRMLEAERRRPVFLSRGYGGSLPGPVRVEPEIHTSSEVGDEPLLLARAAPTIVSRDRVAGANLAAEFGDIVVMDDGFQNPFLHKDLSLLVVDADAGIGNGFCIPAGPLRAPLDAQLARTDALILIGEGRAGEELADHAARRRLPVHRGWLAPEPEASVRLGGRRVLAFAGIGRPKKFADTLHALGADVARLAEFPDHHVFSEQEALDLLNEAARDGLALVTTEKDRARLMGETATVLRELAEVSDVLPVRLVFDDEAAVAAQLRALRR